MNLFEKQTGEFASRHIGPDEPETEEMLAVIGVNSLSGLVDKTVPPAISLKGPSLQGIGEAMDEFEYLAELKSIANKNKIYKSFIGQGYYDTITPSVILRNLFENP